MTRSRLREQLVELAELTEIRLRTRSLRIQNTQLESLSAPGDRLPDAAEPDDAERRAGELLRQEAVGPRSAPLATTNARVTFHDPPPRRRGSTRASDLRSPPRALPGVLATAMPLPAELLDPEPVVAHAEVAPPASSGRRSTRHRLCSRRAVPPRPAAPIQAPRGREPPRPPARRTPGRDTAAWREPSRDESRMPKRGAMNVRLCGDSRRCDRGRPPCPPPPAPTGSREDAGRRRRSRTTTRCPAYNWAVDTAAYAWNTSGARVQFVKSSRRDAKVLLGIRWFKVAGDANVQRTNGRFLGAQVGIRSGQDRYTMTLVVAARARTRPRARSRGPFLRDHELVPRRRPPRVLPAAPAGIWICRLLRTDDVRGAVSLYGGTVRPIRGPEFCAQVVSAASSTSDSGRVLTTSAAVAQPRRAVCTASRMFSRPRTECASVEHDDRDAGLDRQLDLRSRQVEPVGQPVRLERDARLQRDLEGRSRSSCVRRTVVDDPPLRVAERTDGGMPHRLRHLPVSSSRVLPLPGVQAQLHPVELREHVVGQIEHRRRRECPPRSRGARGTARAPR